MAEVKPSVPAPVLDESDRRSATWMKLKQHFEARRDALRARNDGNLDPTKTAKLRGRIAEANYILSLDNPVPLMKVDTDD